MKINKVSENVYKLEAWFMFKMSAWFVKMDDGVYIVDTGMSFMANRIIEEADKLGPLKGILLTHGHSDHVGGLRKILQKQEVPVFSHELEIKYMEGEEPFPGRKKKEFLVEPGIVKPLTQKEDGTLYPIGDLLPYHTPGHSPGHISFYHAKDSVLISGDLFTSKRGKLKKPMSMFTADMEQAVESAKIINGLKPLVVSICHGEDIQQPHRQMDRYLKSYGAAAKG